MDPFTRERLARGATAGLADAELVGVVAGFPQESASHGQVLLAILGGLHEAATHTYDELLAVGLCEAQAGRLTCAFELARRLRGLREPRSPQLARPQDVARLLSPRLASLPQEEAVVVHLDPLRRLLGTTMVARGSACSVEISPADIFRSALRHRAHSIVFAHNHPGGDPQPSQADEHLTQVLTDAGRLIGIPVVDHVIVAAEGYYSFQEAGAAPQRTARRRRRAAF